MKRNAAAFAAFIGALSGDPNADVGSWGLVGPVVVPGSARVPKLPLFLGKASRAVSSPDSRAIQDWDKKRPAFSRRDEERP